MNIRSHACMIAIALSTGWVMAEPAPPAPASQRISPATQPAPGNLPAPRASLELLAQVQKNLRTVDALEADFDQEKNLAVMKHRLNLSGRFALRKPDWVIWIVEKPVRYAIRVRGDEVSQWDEDTNKVQVVHVGGDPTFKAISEQLQAWFLGNYKSLEASYDVYVLSNPPARLSLRFVPKPGTMIAKLVSNIEVTFTEDGKNIEKMVVHETSGDWTNLTIKNARLNQPVNPKMWEIPPK